MQAVDRSLVENLDSPCQMAGQATAYPVGAAQSFLELSHYDFCHNPEAYTASLRRFADAIGWSKTDSISDNVSLDSII